MPAFLIRKEVTTHVSFLLESKCCLESEQFGLNRLYQSKTWIKKGKLWRTSPHPTPQKDLACKNVNPYLRLSPTQYSPLHQPSPVSVRVLPDETAREACSSRNGRKSQSLGSVKVCIDLQESGFPDGPGPHYL
ncbi:unnamed protein product [Rangifer tarandus platyrhynchus]|uniref:Uncharacterized protein n=2 Tax=Rangifer tarandus platyrhynchus TaxID=3082113 RepID=A0ABN8YEY9_RANTA|nr:unnamed protein product [Rangifer tarandus platyrhynchus]